MNRLITACGDPAMESARDLVHAKSGELKSVEELTMESVMRTMVVSY